MTVLIIAVLFAMIASAGCSMIEAVLYSVPLREIESLVLKQKESGRIFKELRSDIEKPITAILSLNTVANTMGAAIAGSAVAEIFGHQWVGYFQWFLH
jgi:CBS domain containing-hemolysin-like protein